MICQGCIYDYFSCFPEPTNIFPASLSRNPNATHFYLDFRYQRDTIHSIGAACPRVTFLSLFDQRYSIDHTSPILLLSRVTIYPLRHSNVSLRSLIPLSDRPQILSCVLRSSTISLLSESTIIYVVEYNLSSSPSSGFFICFALIPRESIPISVYTYVDESSGACCERECMIHINAFFSSSVM